MSKTYKSEALAAVLLHDADEVDDRIGAHHCSRDRSGIAQIRLHRVNLADRPERLQEARKVRPPHGDTHPVAALDERAHDVAPEEAGAAEDSDELLSRGLDGHRESSV